MKFLLTGGNGQVGYELRRTLSPLGKVSAPSRDVLDLEQPESLRSAVRAIEPQVIVNAAAYTAVDQAEGDIERATRINAHAVEVLAEEARRCGALMVHFSTDYVFDGAKQGAYLEGDAPNPLNIYGRSKLAGEEALRARGDAHLIFRTSWVYGARGRNFLLTMRRLARERKELRIVDDQLGAPTWSRMIAEAVAMAINQCIDRDALDQNCIDSRSGTYHLTNAGAGSWHAFAAAILEGMNADVRLIPIPSSGYPSPAPRPRNSVLDNFKLQSVFGLRLPDWREGLGLCLEEFEWGHEERRLSV
jgi:dTDP-4-dehydrorhamnose reductase